MALTITSKGSYPIGGGRRIGVFDLTFDSSYPTNGESLTAADLGFKGVEFVLTSGASGLLFEYDYANSKIKVLYPTGGANSAPTTLAQPTHNVTATVPAGGTPVTSTSDTPAMTIAGGLTPGQAKEVGNTANLSTVVARIQVWGIG